MSLECIAMTNKQTDTKTLVEACLLVKWSNILDTPSLFKWRHEARVQRMEEMEKKKEQESVFKS